MKKKSTKQRPVSLWERVAWRFWRKRAAWREFRERLSTQSARLMSMEPWCEWSRRAKGELNGKLKRLVQDLEDAGSSPSAAFDTFGDLRRRIAQLEDEVRTVIDRDRKWSEMNLEIQNELSDLKDRASRIRGREFAARTTQLAEPLLRHPDGVEAKKHRGRGGKSAKAADTPDRFLGDAQNRLAELRDHVTTAESAIAGWSELKAAISGIDELGVQQDVAAALEYERLTVTRQAIEHELEEGHYQGASHHLSGARRLCSQLQKALEDRFALTRAEIDLWLDDQEISDRYNLKSFPSQLTAVDAQKWKGILVEITGITNARAAATFKAYGAWFPARRNMNVSLQTLENWERLMAFARSAMNASKP
jgi:hypothetical protein